MGAYSYELGVARTHESSISELLKAREQHNVTSVLRAVVCPGETSSQVVTPEAYRSQTERGTGELISTPRYHPHGPLFR